MCTPNYCTRLLQTVIRLTSYAFNLTITAILNNYVCKHDMLKTTYFVEHENVN